MQDIPTNELIEKLAAGWSVRRKSWPDGWSKQKDALPPQHINVFELMADDWQGEPPSPKAIKINLNIIEAFQSLNVTNFIRRASWKNREKFPVGVALVTLSPKDILAADWEVWA
jgi:hypothetical protein